jgi:hypothetical protein
MKKILLLLFLFFPLTGWSEDIKLSCNMKRIKKNSSGDIEKSIEKIIFSVSENVIYKSIISNSDEYGPVSSDSFAGWKFSTDFSDTNKWDITTTTNLAKGEMTTSIKIDRNAGIISYSSIWTSKKGYISETSATGECEKINVMKKKF